MAPWTKPRAAARTPTNGRPLLSAAHAQHDRGRRFDFLTREERALRKHEMHARGLHAVNGADGAGKFAFQRAQVIDVLNKARRAERVALVEDLITDAAALGDSAFGEFHAKASHLVLGDIDRGAVVADLESKALPFKILDDRG